jgi:2-polyprenyl-6-methoxyphenol hydroxylase-like FAD-dependent oxidoreductase
MTPWVRAGAQPASLLALDEVGPVAGWLVIGDGLLTTAPYQGNGFAQLLDQAEALASGLQAEERTADLRLRLFESARRAWFQAACVDCFTAANRPDNEPHPTRRPQAAPGSTGEPLTRTTASRLQ